MLGAVAAIAEVVDSVLIMMDGMVTEIPQSRTELQSPQQQSST